MNSKVLSGNVDYITNSTLYSNDGAQFWSKLGISMVIVQKIAIFLLLMLSAPNSLFGDVHTRNYY